jgi:hypothetical protein
MLETLGHIRIFFFEFGCIRGVKSQLFLLAGILEINLFIFGSRLTLFLLFLGWVTMLDLIF